MVTFLVCALGVLCIVCAAIWRAMWDRCMKLESEIIALQHSVELLSGDKSDCLDEIENLEKRLALIKEAITKDL